MRILKPELVEKFAIAVGSREDAGIDDYSLIDFQVALHVAKNSKTILFSSEQAVVLGPALERFNEAIAYRLPFDNLIFQFDEPIPELTFFRPEHPDEQPDDQLLALLLHQHEDEQGVTNQAIAYFASTAVNRVFWVGSELRYQPGVEASAFHENKLRLQNLAAGLVAYVNSVGFTLREHKVDEKVNRKRVNKGKRKLEPYYTVQLTGQYAERGEGGHGAGAGHTYRYDVRGHFRRLEDGRLIWVRPHQRGLANELYIPAVRKV